MKGLFTTIAVLVFILAVYNLMAMVVFGAASKESCDKYLRNLNKYEATMFEDMIATKSGRDSLASIFNHSGALRYADYNIHKVGLVPIWHPLSSALDSMFGEIDGKIKKQKEQAEEKLK